MIFIYGFIWLFYAIVGFITKDALFVMASAVYAIAISIEGKK